MKKINIKFLDKEFEITINPRVKLNNRTIKHRNKKKELSKYKCRRKYEKI